MPESAPQITSFLSETEVAAPKELQPSGKTIAQNADINVTPFVDIMLVLLIIFMVAAPLATVSIRLDLPPPFPGTVIEPKEPVYVTVQQSGALFIADQSTTLNKMPADLCRALGGGNCQAEHVFIRSEPDVPYREFMAVMNTLQANGFIKVGLLNEDIQ